jgi:Tol biopolymer transport system component
MAGQAIDISDPRPGTHIPADMPAPLISWLDMNAEAWLVQFEAKGSPLLQALVDNPGFVATQHQWRELRRQAGGEWIAVSIYGLGGFTQRETISHGSTRFRVSPDPVQAAILYITKPLPFKKAKNNPLASKLLLADLTATEAPRPILENSPVCFNCHVTSGKHTRLGMDIDYRGDKGGFAWIDFTDNHVLGRDTILSWNDMPAPGPADYSMGLFAKPSPDARYLVATVGESSAFVMMDDPWYSQLFYPATGRIAVHDTVSGRIWLLPGADSPNHIQTGPVFSPSGKQVLFSRTSVDTDLVEDIEAGSLKAEDPGQDIQALNSKYPVRFDIWKLDFNRGHGGTPVPLSGASGNGASNFFPVFSPDGKWIVYTRAPTGLVLQPGSRLWVVPARGGRARELAANVGDMNSWHSFSPNGRWLAFSCKTDSPYTQIYLTHFDAHGRTTPPLRLFRLSRPGMAAMVPEFLSGNTAQPESLVLTDPVASGDDPMAIDGR